MSTTVNETEAQKASAAASGASATERFHADKSPFEAVKDVPAERVDTLAREVLEAIHATVRKHKMTYDEFNALKAWMIDVGQDGEWPLFLDVWLEHVVEEVNTEHREGNKGSIEGPYYVPGAPEQGADARHQVSECGQHDYFFSSCSTRRPGRIHHRRNSTCTSTTPTSVCRRRKSGSHEPRRRSLLPQCHDGEGRR